MNSEGNIRHEIRIALLIDADNSPAAKIEVVLAELAKVGVVNIRRAYGNWKKTELKGWEAALHPYAIRPMQQFDYTKGKNATDMSLCIDALHLLYTERPDAFAIVSSDSDFTPLVLHIKERGAKVFGFGASKTPMPFVDACSQFLDLDKIGQENEVESANGQEADTKPTAPTRVAPAKLRQDTRLVSLLRNAVEAAKGDDGWALLSLVRNQISNQASFDPRNYGYATFGKLVSATELFETANEGTPRVSIRDARKAKPKLVN
ncbi:MAG: NYN domain-containing protein [Sideroxyarcus sp.]|nr:NYN domain-containing protein [Sideroxyarcus sp.]